MTNDLMDTLGVDGEEEKDEEFGKELADNDEFGGSVEEPAAEGSPAEPAAKGEPAAEEVLIDEDLYKEQPEEPHKYLRLELVSKDNLTYTIRVFYQSHGFLSMLVADLLKAPEVDFCSYRKTSLDQPHLTITLKEPADMKELLKRSVKHLRKELVKVREAFEKVKI